MHLKKLVARSKSSGIIRICINQYLSGFVSLRGRLYGSSHSQRFFIGKKAPEQSHKKEDLGSSLFF
jgi:DNA-binding transcriptional regulator LsrR (DeoR family)